MEFAIFTAVCMVIIVWEYAGNQVSDLPTTRQLIEAHKEDAYVNEGMKEVEAFLAPYTTAEKKVACWSCGNENPCYCDWSPQ
jgi:hypothetical protein